MLLYLISFNAGHCENTPILNFIKVEGNVIAFNDLQLKKAFASIVSNPSDKLTSLKLIHPANALNPMVLTESGIIIDVRFTHSSNEDLDITYIFSGILI